MVVVVVALTLELVRPRMSLLETSLEVVEVMVSSFWTEALACDSLPPPSSSWGLYISLPGPMCGASPSN